jgi:hypothetical protein
MYTFEPSDRVLISHASSGHPVRVEYVAVVAGGVVELTDGSCWYPSGIALGGARELRLSPCTPTVNARLKRLEFLRRAREAAEIVWEIATGISPMTEDDIRKVEESAVAAILAHAQGIRSNSDRNTFLENAAMRLDSAGAGALLAGLAPALSGG